MLILKLIVRRRAAAGYLLPCGIVLTFTGRIGHIMRMSIGGRAGALIFRNAANNDLGGARDVLTTEAALREMNVTSRPVTALFVADEARMLHRIPHIHGLPRAGSA